MTAPYSAEVFALGESAKRLLGSNLLTHLSETSNNLPILVGAQIYNRSFGQRKRANPRLLLALKTRLLVLVFFPIWLSAVLLCSFESLGDCDAHYKPGAEKSHFHGQHPGDDSPRNTPHREGFCASLNATVLPADSSRAIPPQIEVGTYWVEFREAARDSGRAPRALSSGAETMDLGVQAGGVSWSGVAQHCPASLVAVTLPFKVFLFQSLPIRCSGIFRAPPR